MRTQKGFTLIELLVVIVIIAILAAIILVAVDPAKRFGDARDARRRSEVVSILNAVLKFQVDNDGDLPTGIDAVTGTNQVLGTAGSGCDSGCTEGGTTEAVCLDLSGDLVDTFLAEMPIDPDTAGTAANTLYFINQTTGGRILVAACVPENAATISVTR